MSGIVKNLHEELGHTEFCQVSARGGHTMAEIFDVCVELGCVEPIRVRWTKSITETTTVSPAGEIIKKMHHAPTGPRGAAFLPGDVSI